MAEKARSAQSSAAKTQDVTKGAYVPGIGNAPQLNGAIFATEAGKSLAKAEKVNEKWYAVKVDSRTPERQKSFDEVRSDVYRALRGRKEGEVRERLIKQLREKYDVVLHMAQLQPKNKAEGAGSTPGIRGGNLKPE
ncbi:hypothetical protein BVY04_00030 [bacterium M21]|nr:hypothetical protein BVY04_00030 [bacterium M21]